MIQITEMKHKSRNRRKCQIFQWQILHIFTAQWNKDESLRSIESQKITTTTVQYGEIANPFPTVADPAN